MALRGEMHPLLHGLLDLLYPPRCEACGKLRREAICDDCRAVITLLAPPWCELCGAPFDPRAQAAPRCEDCRGKRRPFSVARSAAYYEGPLAAALLRFKYHSQMVLAKPLGRIMVEALQASAGKDLDCPTADVVCPVPLHESRLRERGFNQSELLAEAVARAIERPLKHLLTRTRATLPQVDLPAESRAQNVRDAFAPRLEEAIAGQHVLLIDDLYTTGATLLECARVLLRGEAENVRVLTLARALPRWRMPPPAPS